MMMMMHAMAIMPNLEEEGQKVRRNQWKREIVETSQKASAHFFGTIHQQTRPDRTRNKNDEEGREGDEEAEGEAEEDQKKRNCHWVWRQFSVDVFGRPRTWLHNVPFDFGC
jgi:hypothetical protein